MQALCHTCLAVLEDPQITDGLNWFCVAHGGNARWERLAREIAAAREARGLAQDEGLEPLADCPKCLSEVPAVEVAGGRECADCASDRSR